MYINFIDWPNLLNSVGEVGDMWDNFMYIVSIGIDKFIPIGLRVKTCHPIIITITLSILNAIKMKKRLWRNRKDPGVLAEYPEVCFRHKSTAEKFHIRQETELLKYNPKNCYKYLKNKLSSRSSLSNMFVDDNKLIKSDFDKANGFANELKKHTLQIIVFYQILPRYL